MRTYLVDSENVGAGWVNLIPALQEGDKIKVFYTEKSPYMNYDFIVTLLSAKEKPEFIRCKTGSNSLDFALIAELGILTGSLKQGDELVVVSKDKGFDSGIAQCTMRGFSVVRCNIEEAIKRAEVKAEVTIQVEAPVEEVITQEKAEIAAEEPIKEEVKEEAEEAVPVVKNQTPRVKRELSQTLSQLMYLFPTNKELVEKVMTHLYGEAKGKKSMNALNAKNAFKTSRKKHEAWSGDIKRAVFVEILMQKERSLPEGFETAVSEIWMKNPNLNAFRSGLKKMYPDKGEHYYGVLKPFIKSITVLQ